MADDATPPPTPAEEQPEALTRGPVHESFAEPVDPQTKDAVTAPSEPPANIEETPPDQRPEGGNVAWVPGYWGWDADRKGYIWVSGCWRVAPPHMSWVPGYWSHTGAGWEWVPGFWTPAGNEEVEYLAAPPDIAEADYAPAGDAPSADTIWVPPCYYWVDGAYTLRHGYWLAAHPGWVWSPSHYIRTPRGHVFVSGCWDYELGHRGVLFAPVAFSAGFHYHAGYVFSPSIVVDADLLTANLFACPSYCHYYFGDYYDAGYVSMGIYPWFDADTHHRWYDPIFEHERWQHGRSDPHWEANIRHDFDNRRAHVELRPARTYREMETRVSHAPQQQRHAMEVARPLSRVVADKSPSMKYEHITPETRTKIAQQSVDANKFRDERNTWESAKRTTASPSVNERRTAVTPTERRDAAAPSPDRRDVAPAPSRTEATPPAERREQTAPPAEHQERVTPTPDRANNNDARSSQSDRVRMRSRPIMDQPGPSRAGGPPESPPNESAPRGEPSHDSGRGGGGGGGGNGGGGGGDGGRRR